MKGYIDGGVVFLELDAHELRTLFVAVDQNVGHHAGQAAELEGAAIGREELARAAPRGRAMNRRVAGELRTRAAGHKACMRDAGDLCRVLHALTKDRNAR